MEQFIKNFIEQFEDTAPELFTADCKFKELDEWSSLVALSVVGMVDEEYGVSLKGDDIKTSDTIADLFEKVMTLKNA